MITFECATCGQVVPLMNADFEHLCEPQQDEIYSPFFQAVCDEAVISLERRFHKEGRQEEVDWLEKYLGRAA